MIEERDASVESEILPRIEDMTYRLHRYSVNLSSFGILTILLTATNLTLILARLLGDRTGIFYVPTMLFMALLITVFFSTLTVALLRDSLMRRSSALFDETTALFQILSDNARRRKTYIEYSRLREVTRMYALSTDYPLIPGKNGGALIILMNIGLLFFGGSLLTLR